MSFLDYLKGGVIGLLVGMLLAGAGVWWAKDQQVKAVKVELQTAKDANASLEKAKESLREEVKKMDKSCTARINSTDTTIKRLKEIEELKPGVLTNEADNDTGSDNSGDPILDALNGVRRRAAGKN
jgi:tRNA A37 N6-isopentenylltransferase MiaA